MENKKNKIGLFSLLRWSPGSIVLFLIMTIINIFIIVEYIRYRFISLAVILIFSIGIEIFYIIIRRAEIITPSEPINKNYENAVGIAMTDIYPKKSGVIKINNETWSAYSEDTIKKNEKVIVIKKDGLYMIVKRLVKR
ncbi:MAG: NfeD family protein [Thermoplasmata archaeon]